MPQIPVHPDLREKAQGLPALSLLVYCIFWFLFKNDGFLVVFLRTSEPGKVFEQVLESIRK